MKKIKLENKINLSENKNKSTLKFVFRFEEKYLSGLN